MIAGILHRGLSNWGKALAAACLLAATSFANPIPVSAQTGASGLPLPRFVSTRSQPVKVRVGPGQRYNEAWVFKKAGLPVEIIQEYDVWRKIRYADQEEGWIHQSLLTSRRAGIVRPWEPDSRTALYARAEDDANVRAWLPSGFHVSISECDGSWCEVSAEGADESGKSLSISGHIVQFELWGVYPGEAFD